MFICADAIKQGGEVNVLLFHRATNKNADLILTGGFQDGTDSYMTDIQLTGVWFSADEALDENSAAGQ